VDEQSAVRPFRSEPGSGLSFGSQFYPWAVFRPLEPKALVDTSRLVTNAFPNQGSVVRDAWSLPKDKEAARGPLLADSLTSYYLALAGGTMPFIRRYSTI